MRSNYRIPRRHAPVVIRFAVLSILTAAIAIVAAPANAQAPYPNLVSMSPVACSPGSGSFTLTANGSDFVWNSVVEWNGSPLLTTVVSADELTATVPAGDVATDGTESVSVYTPTSGASSPLTFTVSAPASPLLVWTVADNSSIGSLRYAMTNANENPGSTITFDTDLGGAIVLSSVLPQITADTTISGPGATLIAVDGNGAYQDFNVSSSATVTISGIDIENGFESISGGGLYNNGNTTLLDCTLNGNSANNGAAVYNNSTLTVTDCTFTANTCDTLANAYGVAIYNASTATLTNCTIADNATTATAPDFFGAGLYNSGTASLTNCILYDDRGGEITNSGTTTATACDIEGGVGGATGITDGGGNINVNPLLAPIGDYGGDTLTMALLPGSPCLGAGTDAGLVTDQRQISIPEDGRYDIGAFESQGFTVTTTGGDGQSAGATTAFATPLTASVTPEVSYEPVTGGEVSFTAPSSGASATLSPNPATVDINGNVSTTATANSTVGGPYVVVADTNAGFAEYGLTNLNDYTLTTTAGSNGAVSPNGSVKVDAGSNQQFTATPSANYEVSQWSVDSSVVQTGGLTYTINDVEANHTVTVSFAPIIYTVTASAGSNGGISPNGATQIDAGSFQQFTATPNTNYQVYQWKLDGSVVQTGGTTFSVTDVEANHTLSVSFTPVVYSITASSAGNGIISPTGVVQVDAGASQMFTATPNANYQVYQWKLDGSVVQTGGATYTISNVQANHTVAVSYTPILYTLTASAGAGGGVSPSGAVQVDAGSNKQFTATPSANYTVGAWTVNSVVVQTGGTTYTVNDVEANKTVSVNFNPVIYTITTSAGVSGSVSPNGAVQVDGGTNREFIATPVADYAVAQWSLDGHVVQTGGNTYTINDVEANHSLTVTFAVIQYAIVASSGTNGTISPNGTLKLDIGAGQTFTATPSAGFAVGVWTLDGRGVRTGGPFFTISNLQASHTLTVSFIAETHSRFDFNGDLKDDLLWENATSGQLVVWDMNGVTALNHGGVFATLAPPWTVKGVADVNADGHPDLLWWNSQSGQVRFWEMTGATGTTQLLDGPIFASVANTQWQPVSMADFDGDGNPDILWENQTTGQLLVWYMNGSAIKSYGPVFATVPANTRVAGTADFTHNGHPDILLENTKTGALTIWYMGGTAGTTTESMSTDFAGVANTAWQIVSTGDANGDGHPDLTWRNSVTGQTLVWLMGGAAGTTIESQGSPLALTPPSPWNIVGVR